MENEKNLDRPKNSLKICSSLCAPSRPHHGTKDTHASNFPCVCLVSKCTSQIGSPGEPRLGTGAQTHSAHAAGACALSLPRQHSTTSNPCHPAISSPNAQQVLTGGWPAALDAPGVHRRPILLRGVVDDAKLAREHWDPPQERGAREAGELRNDGLPSSAAAGEEPPRLALAQPTRPALY
jgi:hypothetical protein